MAFFQKHGNLLEAAANGDADAVATYIRTQPKWVRDKDKHTGDTALHRAAEKGHVAVMKLLLAAGADPLAWNERYEMPLHVAAANGMTAAVELILGASATAATYINNKSGGGFTPLQKAISSGNAETLNLLLQTGKADLNADNPPALYYAVQQRKVDCVRALLEAGASPNVTHKPEPDHNRRYYRDYNERDYLPRSPLNEALTTNETAIALLLLEKAAKEQSNECLLHLAAQHGNIELATELLALGRDVNKRNPYNETALHIAAQKNNPAMVQFLLANSADKTIVDSNKRTALSMAQQFALKENIDILQGTTALTEPVKRKPVALAPVEPPKPLPAPEPVKAGTDPLFDDETWKLAGTTKLVHINFYPELGRRITEIFNFESRERTIISENLNLRTEAINGQSFDKIGEEALEKALGEYRKLGGQVDEGKVFKDRILKTRPR